MADRPQPQHLQVRPQRPYDIQGYGEHGLLGVKTQQHQGLSTGQVLAVIAGLPVGGTLLALAGLTLMGTIIGVLVATPLFIIFSPVLVPAIFVIGLAVTGFLTSGAFGLTALSSLSWVINHLRSATGLVQQQLGDMAEFVGQKTKDAGQEIQSKAQEEKRKTGHESR